MKNKTAEKAIHGVALDKGCRKFDAQVTYDQMAYNKETKNILNCWGAEQFTRILDIGFAFKVNGYLHKGYVLITLSFMDTYDIHLLDEDGIQVGESHTDVYFDQLTYFIDSLVETAPN